MIELGTVKVRWAKFSDGHNEYVVGLDGVPCWERQTIAGTDNQATGINLDDSIYDRFFMVYVADCAFPPIAIVRMDNEQEAEEEFVDQLDWAHIKEPDLADYDPDSLSYGPSGQPYDSSEVMVREVRLVATGS